MALLVHLHGYLLHRYGYYVGYVEVVGEDYEIKVIINHIQKAANSAAFFYITGPIERYQKNIIFAENFFYEILY